MVVGIVAGRGGVGKTSQLITLTCMLSPTYWAIMEKKDEQTLNAIKEIDAELIYIVDKQYNTDPVKILKTFGEWRDSVLASSALKCVVVDGVSDLRNYAMKEWLRTHPIYDKKTGEKRERKTIGGENLGAWSEINERVRFLIEPLINYALFNNVHLFMTAQMKDKYGVVTINNKKTSVRLGQEPDIKEWLEYPCECLLILKKSKNSEYYECSCEKAPGWCGESGWVEELHKDTGLLEVLSKHKLI